MGKRVPESRRELDAADYGLSDEIASYLILQRSKGPVSRETEIGWLRALLSQAVKLMEGLCLEEGKSVPDSARERLYQEVIDYLREKIRWESQLR